jgi:hypothetical protein
VATNAYCPQGGEKRWGHAYRNGNEIIWESAGSEDGWLDYPGQRTYWLNWKSAVYDDTRIDTSELSVVEIQAYVSTQEYQSPTTNFVEAAGQLAVITYLGSDQVNIFNATCTEYFLRVVMRAQITQADGGGADSEAGPDSASAADAPDAIAEATTDASSDAGDGAD